MESVKADGLRLPRLYAMGWPHNNCGGFCIKQGHAGFAMLYRELPDRFMAHASAEQRFREMTGKDVSILRDRRGGTTKPLTLMELARRVDEEPELIDAFDLGGCACMDPPISGERDK